MERPWTRRPGGAVSNPWKATSVMEDQPESSGGNGADPAPDSAGDPAPDPAPGPAGGPAGEPTGAPAGEATPGPAGEALGAGAPGAQAALPLFYKDPQPLHTAGHAGKGLRKPVDYRCAAATHAVLLHAQEFRLAAAHYPIVFADDASSMPLAVLGFRDGENLFVDASGAWAEGTYIPSYVRRYPFATGRGAKKGEQILYLEEGSELIVDLDSNPDAEALFVDGAPSERTKQALEFCVAFGQQTAVTTAFIEEVKARGLLGAKEVRLDLPAGGSQLLTGLRVIEEDKFNALPDEAVLEWRRQGWLPLVYWHWASMDNFFRLLRRG